MESEEERVMRILQGQCVDLYDAVETVIRILQGQCVVLYDAINPQSISNKDRLRGVSPGLIFARQNMQVALDHMGKAIVHLNLQRMCELESSRRQPWQALSEETGEPNGDE